MTNKKVGILVPIYPVHYWRGYDLLESFRKYRINKGAEINFIFTNEEEAKEFKYDGGYNSLILPKELRIFNKANGIINIKKFAGLMQLEDKYEYTIVLDAESKFIKKANLYKICKKYFNDRVLYGNKLNSVNQQNTLKDACKSFFNKDERIKLNNYDDYYLWFNQLCIYKNSTLKEFFKITNIKEKIKDLTFYNFDYYIYMYYLLLYQNFSIQDLDIITEIGALENTINNVIIKSNKYKKMNIYLSSSYMYQLLKLRKVFLLINIDRYYIKSDNIIRRFINKLKLIKRDKNDSKIIYKENKK